jgi:hypothetical protein
MLARSGGEFAFDVQMLATLRAEFGSVSMETDAVSWSGSRRVAAVLEPACDVAGSVSNMTPDAVAARPLMA